MLAFCATRSRMPSVRANESRTRTGPTGWCDHSRTAPNERMRANWRGNGEGTAASATRWRPGLTAPGERKPGTTLDSKLNVRHTSCVLFLPTGPDIRIGWQSAGLQLELQIQWSSVLGSQGSIGWARNLPYACSSIPQYVRQFNVHIPTRVRATSFGGMHQHETGGAAEPAASR